MPKHVAKLLLVVVEAVGRRVVDAPDVDHDVALVERLLVPGAEHLRVGEGGGASQQSDAEGLVAVERAVVGADGRGGGGHAGRLKAMGGRSRDDDGCCSR